MTTLNSNNFENAENLISRLGVSNQKVKYIKKERGLIEREENDEEKIILAEDNRQILLG